MSPVEFSNYIKQRTSMQQPSFMQSPNSAMMGHNLKPSRSISPANHSSGLSINSDPFYYHHNSNSHGGYYASQQPYLGSHQQQQHHQLGYGTGLTGNGGGGGSPLVTPSATNNPISSSISSISSASSSSASSSVSSSSLGEHLLQFGSIGGGGPFGGNSNQLSEQMYNFYGAANETSFMDNGFFASLNTSSAIGNQLEDSVPANSLLEGNPKFGVIGGGINGSVAQSEGGLEELGSTGLGLGLETNNNNLNSTTDSVSANGSPNSGSNNSMDNLQSNNFYSGSSGSPFPQLLVAN